MPNTLLQLLCARLNKDNLKELSISSDFMSLFKKTNKKGVDDNRCLFEGTRALQKKELPCTITIVICTFK